MVNVPDIMLLYNYVFKTVQHLYLVSTCFTLPVSQFQKSENVRVIESSKAPLMRPQRCMVSSKKVK